MENKATILTNNLQKLTVSHLYTAFLYRNSIENWYGILEFENTYKGQALHKDVVDFILDMDLELVKTDYRLFLDLKDNEGEGILPSNFHCWIVRDYDTVNYFKKVCTWVKNNY